MLVKPKIIGILPVRYEKELMKTKTFIFTRIGKTNRCSYCDFNNFSGFGPPHCQKYTILLPNWKLKTLYELCFDFKYYKLYRIV